MGRERFDFHFYRDERATPRHRLKSDHSGVRNVSAFDCAPGYELVGPIVGYLRIPFFLFSARQLGHPMRLLFAYRAYGVQICHKLWQIFEMSPKLINILRLAIDQNTLFDAEGSVLAYADFFSCQLLSTTDVQSRHAGHCGCRKSDTRKVGGLGLERRAEKSQANNIAADTRPHPFRGRSLTENAEAAGDFPQTDQSHQQGTFPDAKKFANGSRRPQLPIGR